MEHSTRFTVCFQAPFWVGVAERWEDGTYSAARVVFGAEPTDARIYEWLEREWHRLTFTAGETGTCPSPSGRNPKRAQREAAAATRERGVSTRAQEALSRQREQTGLLRRTESRQARLEAEERKFQLKQQKKREKKRGR